MSPNFNDSLPLLIAMAIVFCIVLCVDFVLLFRWAIYQRRLKDAINEHGIVYDEPFPADWVPPQVTFPISPVLPNSDFDLSPVIETPNATQEQIAKEPVVLLPPFAKRWSLVHPFLGFQFIILAANIFAIFPVILLIVGYILMGKASKLSEADSHEMQTVMTGTIALTLLIQNILTVYVVKFFVTKYGDTLTQIGLPRRPSRKQITMGIGFGLILLIVAQGIGVGFEELLKQNLNPKTLKSLQEMGKSFEAGRMFLEITNPFWKLLFFIGGAIAAPIGEEIFFRGFLYNALRKNMGIALAVFLNGLCFALIHASPLAIIVIIPMGMALAYVYEKTRSLWVTILMHAVNNGVVLLLVWLGILKG